MERKVLEALKAQAEVELKKIAEEVGRLQYEALLRTSFIAGVEKELQNEEGSAPDA